MCNFPETIEKDTEHTFVMLVMALYRVNAEPGGVESLRRLNGAVNPLE